MDSINYSGILLLPVFHIIILNKMSQFTKELNTLLINLENNTCNFPDLKILTMAEEYDNSLKTNCETAAKYLFSLISSICAFRPSLERLLIHMATEPLYYLGIQTPEGVMKWLDLTLKDKLDEPLFSKHGKKWLQTELPQKARLIMLILIKLKAMTYIQNLTLDLTWAHDTDKATVHDEDKGYISFTAYKDLYSYLVDKFKQKLAKLKNEEVNTDELYKDSNYLIQRELNNKRYNRTFKHLGWI